MAPRSIDDEGAHDDCCEDTDRNCRGGAAEAMVLGECEFDDEGGEGGGKEGAGGCM